MQETRNNTPDSQPLKGRQEMFCQLYSTGKLSASEAYRQAGYAAKDADANSSILMVKHSIKNRIDYLRAETAERLELTREIVLRGVQHGIEMAEAKNDATNVLRGYELLGKAVEGGIWKDKR